VIGLEGQLLQFGQLAREQMGGPDVGGHESIRHDLCAKDSVPMVR
jgi:hypothetical protein